jgi:hypothetical protein
MVQVVEEMRFEPELRCGIGLAAGKRLVERLEDWFDRGVFFFHRVE